jgi:hypothetical protein
MVHVVITALVGSLHKGPTHPLSERVASVWPELKPEMFNNSNDITFKICSLDVQHSSIENFLLAFYFV